MKIYIEPYIYEHLSHDVTYLQCNKTRCDVIQNKAKFKAWCLNNTDFTLWNLTLTVIYTLKFYETCMRKCYKACQGLVLKHFLALVT